MFEKQREELRRHETADARLDTHQVRKIMQRVSSEPTRMQRIALIVIQTAMVLFAALIIYLTLANW